MPKAESYIPDILVRRLELWTQRLFKIAREMEQCRYALADLGVIATAEAPRVTPGDQPGVIRLKEALLSLARDRSATCRQMAQARVEVLNDQTLEVVIPAGPAPGSYLSWLPGEPSIAWWREKKALDAPRRPLPGIDQDAVKPVLH